MGTICFKNPDSPITPLLEVASKEKVEGLFIVPGLERVYTFSGERQEVKVISCAPLFTIPEPTKFINEFFTSPNPISSESNISKSLSNTPALS